MSADVEVPRPVAVQLVHQSGAKYDFKLQTGQTSLCIPRSGAFTIESDKCVRNVDEPEDRLTEKSFSAPSTKVLKFAIEEVSTELMVGLSSVCQEALTLGCSGGGEAQVRHEDFLRVQLSSGKKVDTIKAEPKGDAYVATIWTKPGQVVMNALTMRKGGGKRRN
eukprot:747623-Hanusia_phi.AAC.3